MKKLIYLFSAIVLITTACKKENEEPKQETPQAQTPCGNGYNFCFEMDGTNYGGTAELMTVRGIHRVYWYEETPTFQQVELYLAITQAGTYPMNETDTVNVLKFEYAKAGSPPINTHIINGTATITLFDPTGEGVSGTFSGTTETGEVKSGIIHMVK